MKVCVFGAGYVGLVTSACLAEMGNSVVCIDVDAQRVAALQRGEVPIHEPGLQPMIVRCAAAGRLVFSTDAADAVAHSTVIFIAVGTPASEDGGADVEHVLTAARTIGSHMSDYKVVVDKSTVPVGTADRVHGAIREQLARRGAVLPYAVVSNPEFLKEGCAVDDFMKPDRVIVGADDERAGLLMRAIYAPFLRKTDRLLMMDVRSAEMTKYAANAMLAARISFINELARLAEAVGADIEQVRLGIGTDRRIGPDFLYPGCGWGGSCLPKDIKALLRTGADHDVPLDMLRAVQGVNERQRRLLGERVVERFGPTLQGRCFAVWGLAFKPGTDDLREAPSLAIIDELVGRGARIRAFDPVAMPRARALWPEGGAVELTRDALSAADGADALLVVTEWREFRSPDFDGLRARLKTPLVIDGRNIYDPALLESLGFEYIGIGRGARVQDSDSSTVPAEVRPHALAA